MFKISNIKILTNNVLLFVFLWGCGKQEKQMFSSLSAERTGIQFSNIIKMTNDVNIVEYMYAYNGGGVAIGDVNNDGLLDIYFTANQIPNKLYLNQGGFVFKDITDLAGVEGFSGPNSWTTGVTMTDVNGDGFLDIYVSVIADYKQFKGHNQLFINNKDLTFTEASEEYGLNIIGFSQQAYFFDFDIDGDLDMYQLRHAIHKSEVYQQENSRNRRDILAGDLLFKNENNKFIDISDSSGIYGGSAGYGLAAAVSDIDNNGYPDIYISNDFHENDFLYYNNGNETFTENGTSSFGHTTRFSMGNDISDINNDGFLDIISLDMKPYDENILKKSMGEASFNIYEFRLGFGYHYQYPRNMLQINRGQLFNKGVQFSEIGQQAGIDATDWSWGPLVADFDNDGWKDLIITNGIPNRPNNLDFINFAYNEHAKDLTDTELVTLMPDGAVPNFAYKNNRKNGFIDVSKEWGVDFVGYSMGAAYGDLDNDGDLDLIINNLNNKATILENQTREINRHNFLKVKINGPKKNRFGIGAKIEVQTRSLNQIQEVSPTRGWLSSVDPMIHFGLSNDDSIKSVKIVWPGGASQIVNNVKLNSTLELNWKDAKENHMKKVESRKLFTALDLSGIDFVHKENEYIDFEFERLMPHKLSKEGPRFAVGDINGDGLADLYIGGAKGQSGELYMQTRNNLKRFKRIPVNGFLLDKEYEDVDATFFDADNDGDLDLYVVSGGGENFNIGMLSDRLYFNDGRGVFIRNSSTFTANTNGSVVVTGDFDNDGDIDLFIGARSIIGRYGISPKSDILWNEGNGIFSRNKSNEEILKLGMITDAVFLKSSHELILVGEWMPITIASFREKKMEIRSLQNSSGWWNTIYADDMDGDGDMDLLAGNNGTNSVLKPSVDKPIGLYVKDFDRNSSTDPIITYWRDGNECIFVGLDELKGQIVSIRKQFNSYEEYAGKTFKEIITPAMQTNAVHKQAVTFESVYIENLGNDEFKIFPLPLEAQWSSIFGFLTEDFDNDGTKDILSIGNFYGYQPYIGRADASYGNFLKGNGKGKFELIEPRNSGWAIKGEARDLKMINIGEQESSPLLMVSRNNDTPLIFSYTN